MSGFPPDSSATSPPSSVSTRGACEDHACQAMSGGVKPALPSHLLLSHLLETYVTQQGRGSLFSTDPHSTLNTPCPHRWTGKGQGGLFPPSPGVGVSGSNCFELLLECRVQSDSVSPVWG